MTTIFRTEKRCSDCKETKSVEEFSPDKSRPDGYRYVCRPCAAARRRDYYRRNREKQYAYTRQYVQSHREEVREWHRRWVQKNPERFKGFHRDFYHRHKDRPDFKADRKQRNAQWQRENKVAIKAKDHRRRTRLLNAAGDASTAQIQARIDYYGGRCWMCGADGTEIDHVIPLAGGGSNWPANLRPACRTCNSRKGAKRLLLSSGL